MDPKIGPYWVRHNGSSDDCELAHFDGSHWLTFGTGDYYPANALVAVAPATFAPKASGDFSIGCDVWPGTSKLLEEQGELIQVLGKLMATGGDTKHWSGDLRKMLIDELADVAAAVVFFQRQNLTPEEILAVTVRCETKLALFQEWQANPSKP